MNENRVTLALAAVPPFLLVYWSTVSEPHLETNVFGVWLLLLALAGVLLVALSLLPRWLRGRSAALDDLLRTG